MKGHLWNLIVVTSLQRDWWRGISSLFYITLLCQCFATCTVYFIICRVFEKGYGNPQECYLGRHQGVGPLGNGNEEAIGLGVGWEEDAKPARDRGPDGIPATSKKCAADLDHHQCFFLPEASQVAKGTEGKEEEASWSQSLCLLWGWKGSRASRSCSLGPAAASVMWPPQTPRPDSGQSVSRDFICSYGSWGGAKCARSCLLITWLATEQEETKTQNSTVRNWVKGMEWKSLKNVFS